jgi:hypothetical protein
MPVVHLITQHNQPYGSVRKCCEYCGIWIIGSPEQPPRLYTEDPGDLRLLPAEYRVNGQLMTLFPCDGKSDQEIVVEIHEQ